MGHDEAGGPSPQLLEQLVVLSAPTQAWSARDGSMGAHPVHGVFHGEWRYLRDIELLVDGAPVEHLSTSVDAGATAFHGVAAGLDDAGGSGRVLVERTREVTPGELVERVTVVNERDVPIAVAIELGCELAFARLADVRSGEPGGAGIDARLEHGEAVVTDGTRTLRVRGGGDVSIVDDRVVVARHRLVRPGDWCTLELELELEDLTLAVRGVLVGSPCPTIEPTGREPLDRWTERAVADVEDLLLDAGHGAFPAAGAPWHLTLSAREALVASRLLLPLGPRIAEGTLRTLAARQGVRHDPATGEEPGRIPHEMRQHRLEAQRPVEPPPRFTRALDDTPLWIVLLHDAWRAGLPIETVRELRLALHAALWWLQQHSRTGFLEASQTDGREAAGAVAGVDAALQALACRAAMGGAALLAALGDDGDPWLAWAERLRRRFRASFWVTRSGTRFPVAGLDPTGAAVPALGAAMGQLLGSTLLDPDEERIVARLLLDDRLSTGWGLRSLADDAAGHDPMAEHAGAVRPLDTAVAIEGLLHVGLHATARALAEQLVRAADAFEGRMPEAYGGHAGREQEAPLALPGACAPHVCSAAAVVPVRRALATAGSSAAPSDGEPDGEPGERPDTTPDPAPMGPAPARSAPAPTAPAPTAPPPIAPAPIVPTRRSAPPSPEPPPIIARGGARSARAHLRLVEPAADER